MDIEVIRSRADAVKQRPEYIEHCQASRLRLLDSVAVKGGSIPPHSSGRLRCVASELYRTPQSR